MTIDTAHLRALLAAVTSEYSLPWRVDDQSDPFCHVQYVRHASATDEVDEVVVSYDDRPLGTNVAALIAAAVSALPQLLDELAAKDAEIERMRSVLEWIADARNNIDTDCLSLARAELMGMAFDFANTDAVDAAWDARAALAGEEEKL